MKQFSNVGKTAITIILTLWLVVLVSRNIFRQLDWIDPIKFYSQTLAHAPKSIRIRNGLAMAYAERGDNNEAIQQYNNAIAIDPNVPNLYHNLANAYLAKGDVARAEENYLTAIKVDPMFSFSYGSLYSLYAKTGQTQKAQEVVNNFNARFDAK